MPYVTDTAYARLKAHPTAKELDEIYTPNLFGVVFAEERTRQPAPRVGLLLLLKTFQRLGYFVPYTEIPPPIVSHVARCAGYSVGLEGMVAYNASTARDRHMALVRAFIGVTAYGSAARKIIVEASLEAARTRDDLADIINVAIEELVRQRYELPAFGTLLKLARAARARVNRDYQTQVCDRLDATARARLFMLLTRVAGDPHSLWDRVKREPKRPTVRHLEECLTQVQCLQDQHVTAQAFAGIPDVKDKQFAAEARSLDVTSMNDLPERKRLTLAAALVLTQVTRALDDVAEMFLRQVQRMHNEAHGALFHYQVEHADRTDALITLLRDVTLAYKAEGTHEQRFATMAALLGPDPDGILARCEAHRAVAGNNHLPFLLPFYRGQRGALYRFLDHVPLMSTSQDQAVSQAVAFLLEHQASRQEWLPIVRHATNAQRDSQPVRLVDLSFVSEKWWPLVTGMTYQHAAVTRVERRYFELCVFSQLLLELKSGDLCIPGSDRFSDYRKQLVSPEEYAHEIARYGEQAGIPTEGKAFVEQLRSELERAAQRTNDGLPTNEYVRIEHGESVLKRLRRQPDPTGLRRLEQLRKERMPPVGILDALSDTEHWLHWTQHFGPLSGYEAKLEQPRERYLMTTFCYGCNLGPTQTARSIKGLDLKQVAFVNQRHVIEERLNEAIVTVINAYHRFPLQELWGTGTSASADGTKWDLYP